MAVKLSNCYFSVNSEYKTLKSVLLFRPGNEIETIDSPEKVLHIRSINYEIMNNEYGEIIKLYKGFGINIYFINSTKIKGDDDSYLFNMMYARDLLFMTFNGAILAGMKYDIRRNEVKYVERTLKKKCIPVKATVKNSKTFEGADALWVNERLVLVGTGNRTSIEGYLQIKSELRLQQVNCISVSVPEGIQHLLGVLQFVDKDLALVRVDLVDREITDILEQNNIRIIDMYETEEIKNRQGMNIVTIAPKKIIMPTRCVQTKKKYEHHGLKVAAEVDISQLINGGGGLACATAVIARAL